MTKTEVREKLIDLIHKAKLSMWGKNGLSNELARNSYIADYLIANGTTVQEWIPVSEELPNVDKTKSGYEQIKVIAATASRSFPAIYERACVRGKKVYRWKWLNDRIYDGQNPITHWMHLPEPPKGE